MLKPPICRMGGKSKLRKTILLLKEIDKMKQDLKVDMDKLKEKMLGTR